METGRVPSGVPLRPPDRFVAGTVGLPGAVLLPAGHATPGDQRGPGEARSRRSPSAWTSFSTKSCAVAAGARPYRPWPHGDLGTAPLDTPIDEEFRVGTWHWPGTARNSAWSSGPGTRRARRRFRGGPGRGEERLLQDEENGPPMLRVRLTGAQARAFAKRALDVVNAGRRRARCAVSRSTRKDTYVRARTDTAAERDHGRAARRGRARRVGRTHP
ncbi:DUF3090 family protein [Streptomyces sp. T1317-0309]|nr:DUF3090 family protein [Streptomyces sp. T1317-0309]